ncbi:MAG: hypothetical protein ACLPXB_03465 [Thiobacillaceae bacterium]
MKSLSSCLALLFFLTGCGTTGRYGMDSPYYEYPNGVRLILNQPLEIPPDAATVRLQYGKVVAPNGVQEEDPYCIVELSTVADEPQRVQSGAFSVTRVRYSISTIARGESLPTGLVQVSMASNSSGPSNYYYKTEFFLHSDAQPNMLRMTCQSNQNYTPLKRYLTVGEIRQALGNIFTLKLPSNPVSNSNPDAGAKRLGAPV